MAIVAGTRGSITNASGYATAINRWSITVAVAEQEVTSWDDVAAGVLYRKRIPGIREWSGSYSGFLDATDVGTLGEGSELSATFTIDDTLATDGTIAGTIVVTSIAFDVDANGVPTISVDFVGSGAPTITAASA